MCCNLPSASTVMPSQRRRIRFLQKSTYPLHIRTTESTMHTRPIEDPIPVKQRHSNHRHRRQLTQILIDRHNVRPDKVTYQTKLIQHNRRSILQFRSEPPLSHIQTNHLQGVIHSFVHERRTDHGSLIRIRWNFASNVRQDRHSSCDCPYHGQGSGLSNNNPGGGGPATRRRTLLQSDAPARSLYSPFN